MTWVKSPLRAQIHAKFSGYTQSTYTAETTFHFLLSCNNYSDERLTLLSKIRNISLNILENTNSQITQFSLYGDKNFVILNSTIEYILATKRFDKPLFL